jgi:hypothetical protein
LPDDYLEDEDIDGEERVRLELEIEKRIGPWFDLSHGMLTLQFLIQSIEEEGFQIEASVEMEMSIK